MAQTTTYSATQLLNAIRNRGPVPENDIRFDQEKIFMLINEEMRNTVFPMMLSLNNEYFLTTTMVDINTHNNNGLFPLPQRAYARTLRELRFIDNGDNVYNVPRINLNDSYFYPNVGANFIATRTPFGAYFYNDSVKMLGNVQQMIGVLEFTFVLRPPVIEQPDVNYNVLGFPITSTEVFVKTQVGANPATDQLDVADGTDLANGMSIILSSTLALPTGLGSSNYYIINLTGSVFQISETYGGAPATFIDSGLGNLSFTVYVVDDQNQATSIPMVKFVTETSPFEDYVLEDTVGTGYELFDIVRITTGAIVADNIPMRVSGSGVSPTFTDIIGGVEYETFNGMQSPYNDPELYLMPAERTGYVTLPLEAQELLVIAVCQRFYEALGYTDDFAIAERQQAKIKTQLQTIYAERLTGEPQVVTNRTGIASFMLYGKRGTGLRRRMVL